MSKAQIQCNNCFAGSYEDEYKGDTVLRCKSCGEILFRGFKP